ncbi:hypothetical protein WJX79_009454, partial [Trebouxia sp. C0005]
MITAMSPTSVISTRVQVSVGSQRRSALTRNSIVIGRRSVVRRAGKGSDIGAKRPPTLFEAQSFDGPAPETINGRLAMLGVTSALAAELVTGVGLREQWLKAPAPILFSFAIIAIASYIPILKGFTRKEPFENEAVANFLLQEDMMMGEGENVEQQEGSHHAGLSQALNDVFEDNQGSSRTSLTRQLEKIRRAEQAIKDSEADERIADQLAALQLTLS